MEIKFVDLKRQLFGHSEDNTKGIYEEIMGSINSCIKDTSFIMGSHLEKFEEEFAKYCGRKYCVGLNSGTDALEFLLLSKGITGGNVITVPNTYFTTASSIITVGAEPKFVDVDVNSFNLDISKLEEAIDENTKAIVPVHLYGRPAQMDKIIDIAKKYNLEVIEDCCQAHGARFNNTRVPISGNGAFSFFPGKNLGCFGDGGAIVTDSLETYNQIKMLRNDGSNIKYHHEIIGRKARLDNLQAAVLSVKLPYLDKWNSLRREIAEEYDRNLENVKEIQLSLPKEGLFEPVYHVYPIFTKERKKLADHLRKNGIETNIHYPTPIHLQPAYKKIENKSYPVTERLSQEELSLPMFPEMKKDEVLFVCSKIKDFFKENK